jgi:hypothetical protein
LRSAGLASLLAALLSAVLTVSALPASASAQTTREGILRETIRENLRQGESVTTYSLESGERITRLLPTSPVTAESGEQMVARGTMEEGRLVGSIAPPGAATAIGPIPGPIFSGPRKVAVLLVKFAGDPAEPWPPAVIREKIFTGAASADVFFQEESRGVISLGGKANPEEGDVFGWFTLSSSGAGCSQNTWANEAMARASESGVALAGYNHIVFVYTHRSGCFWNGMATVGGNSGTIHFNGNVGVQTIAHEFGHNFGFYHAGSMSCTRGGVRVQVSSSCSVNPYGDVFDAMGNVATRHNSGWNLAKIGILAAANVVTVTADGTYALRAALSLDPAPTILRIPRTTDQAGSVTSWYYLELRQQGGVFENLDDASMQGVSIRAAPITSFDNSGFETETQLIDANPSTSTFVDAPLQVGNTFYDGKIRIKTLTSGGGAASVSVELDVPDEEAPSAPSNLSASQNATDVKLQWSASTDNLGVARYVVFRDGLEIGTSPGTIITDTSATPGQHTYTVYADDEAGNRSAGSPELVVTVATDPGGPADPGDGPGGPGDGPALPGDGATDPGDTGSEDESPRVKPALRWQRRANGTFAVEVNASQNPRVARVSLWLDGKLLRESKGKVLRLIWNPHTARCARAHRLIANAYERTDAGRVIVTTRVRVIRFPELVGKCRGRGGAGRRR